MEAPDKSETRLRETPVDQTRRLPADAGRTRERFSPTRLFADNAFAARMWFLVACGAVAFAILQPYLIIGAYRMRERVVVLDGGGTFSVSPLLGFEEARELHEAMALWATLAFFQRNPRGFDYPDMLQKLFLVEAAAKAQDDREQTHEEFEVKNIHQKPEVFRIEILQTRNDYVLVRVEGQLIRTGVFGNQAFTESPKFTLNLSFARNPNMLANKRYPLGVWKYDYTLL
ncbi:hypothetical protein Ga0100231_018905 [Opitutaceae bacterium TAV4]|nr:hypothetical protein Ga0100231_018905 [Opitutaceae bacterium TAV4]RRK00167.1 hypothetical protein Ga0100230_019570 [Opitutaceae bacterium TAV3]